MNVSVSPDDIKKISKIKSYDRLKVLLRAIDAHKEVKVGEAYLLKNSKDRYILNQDKSIAKFVIIHKDEAGCVFAKTVGASGRLNSGIYSLTTDYYAYTLELDPSLVESILLDNEKQYDPTLEAKEKKRKKDQAANINKSKRLLLETPEARYAFISSLKLGDVFYMARTLYGKGRYKYTVKDTSVKVTPPYHDKTNSQDYVARAHAENKLPSIIKVECVREEIDGFNDYFNGRRETFTAIDGGLSELWRELPASADE